MANVYKKKYPANPINLSNGKPILFEDMGDSFGFLVTTDPQIITEFNLCISQQRGGLTASTQAEYDEALKKKPSSPRSTGLLHRELQTAGLITINLGQPDEVRAASVEATHGVKTIEPEPEKPRGPVVPPQPKLGKRAILV